MMALCITVFFGFAALGFDLAYVRLARLQLQNATDAAAHAALVRLRATGNVGSARAMAKSVAAQNYVWGKSITLQDAEIVFGGWNFDAKTFTNGVSPANAVQVKGTRSSTSGVNGAVGLTFGTMLGRSSIDLQHYGTAAYRIRSIVVAQDITGSFSDSIDTACSADVTMLDTLHSFNIPADRIGMQVFTGGSTLFTPLTYLQADYSSVQAQWRGDGKLVSNTSKTSGITICHKLDYATPYGSPYDHGWMPACSQGEISRPDLGTDGTNPGAAIKAAMDQLQTQSNPYETRVIVLITDGEPSCCTTVRNSAGKITYLKCNPGDACSDARAQYGVDMANAADAADISIFTISFGASVSQAKYTAGLARGIGVAYDTPYATELAAILIKIAGTIPIALVQ
ncbi:MAG: pilus assembly protein TadG-related protein [Myxococcales bacterium]